MNNLINKFSSFNLKQKVAVLFVFVLLILLGITLTAVPKKQEIRPKAAGSGDVDLRFVPASGIKVKNDTFKVDLRLYKTASRNISSSGAQAVVAVSDKFTINSATCEAPFNGLPVANISGQTVTFICGIALGTNPVVLDATGKSFASVNVTIKNDAADGAAPVTFSSTRVTEAGQAGQAPDVSTGGQNASFTVGGDTITGIPKNKVSWITENVTLEADDFYIVAKGRKYFGKPDPGTTIQTHSSSGNPEYTTLELIWKENGVEMRMFMYFNADSSVWWLYETRTYNGQTPGDWIYYKNPSLEGNSNYQYQYPWGARIQLGTPYLADNINVISDANNQIQGSIHFENLKLQPFTKSDRVGCLTIPTTDTFEGTDLNTNLWDIRSATGGSGVGNVSQSGGLLRTSIVFPANALLSPADTRAGVKTKSKVCGDFDVRVDFSQFSHGQGSSAIASLSATDAQSNYSAIIQMNSNERNNQGISTIVQLDDAMLQGEGIITGATTGKLRIRRRGPVFDMYYDIGSGWQLLKSYVNGFTNDVQIEIGVRSLGPEYPAVSANFDNFSLTRPVPEPTFTPVPSITLTPTVTPQPTPPSGQDKYTIDVGDKQFLTFNIAPGQTPQIRFKAQLSNLANKPQMFLKLRVKDELAFIKNPSEGGGSDSCNNPPEGSKDFNIPAQADGDVYKPVQDINGPPPGGGKAATVSVDGWVSLDGVVPGRYYTFLLKGPKTRSVKVAEHVLLQPNQNTEIQDFDWTSKPIDPGDLPDPNNSMKQDCTVNSIDLSLITSRLGATDGDNLNIGDVNYDGIINGNDVSKVVNTLSTKPDDDL